MVRRTSIKNIEMILAIRDLQKIISNTESPEVVEALKQARNSLIKMYSENNKQEAKQIIAAIECMSNR